MKFYRLLAFTLITFAFFSCSKDDEPKPEPNTAPKIADQSFVASEDVSDTQVIGTVTATDADEDALTFSITTNDNDLFKITEAGALSLASGKSLDFNTAKSHQITVGVSDGEDEATAKVTITVTNVNSSAQMEDQEFIVAENIDDAFVIGTVQATDEDGDTLVFSIITNDNDLFEITDGGALSLAEGKSLDFKTADSHSITVGASDGTDTAAAEITILVTDVNAGTPEMEDQSFTVAEDVDETTPIGTVVATDVDGDDLTFAIVTNDNDLFEITETGELSLANGQALDYETATSHSIVVSVTDGVGEAQAQVDIAVENVMDTLAEDPDSFVTTWQTETDGETITIYTREELSYNYTIDWGDGTIESIQTSDDAQHQYAKAGTYTVAIQGQFPAIWMGKPNLGNHTLKYINQWGSIQWETMRGAFHNCRVMVYDAKDQPNLSQVTDMSHMFAFAYLFNGDIGNWDVSNVTNMQRMFWEASVFNNSLNEWVVTNITNMSGLFERAKQFNGSISEWDVMSVTTMNDMFRGAESFNQDISGWDVKSVTSMDSMFRSASSFNQDIGSWDVSQVIDMESMFNRATSFNGNIDGWDVSNVIRMNSMFSEAFSFNQNIGSWNVGSVITMQRMFYRAVEFDADLSSWNTNNVIDMGLMFYGANVFNGDISGWDVGSVVTMHGMFTNAFSFNRDLGNWDIGFMDDMTLMFDFSGMSQANYSATLVGWSNLQTPPQNVTLGASGLTFCGMEAIAARDSLINSHGWSFVGDSECN